MKLPPAIIFINNDFNSTTQSTLISQLFIHESMTGTEFNSRVTADPNYPTIIHLNNLRILVIQESFQTLTNSSLADVILFFQSGLVSVLENNCGPPGLTLSISNLNVYDILRYNNSSYTVNLPQPPTYPYPACCTCIFRYQCNGINALRARDLSGVSCPNIDSECNNTDFINR